MNAVSFESTPAIYERKPHTHKFSVMQYQDYCHHVIPCPHESQFIPIAAHRTPDLHVVVDTETLCPVWGLKRYLQFTHLLHGHVNGHTQFSQVECRPFWFRDPFLESTKSSWAISNTEHSRAPPMDSRAHHVTIGEDVKSKGPRCKVVLELLQGRLAYLLSIAIVMHRGLQAAPHRS